MKGKGILAAALLAALALLSACGYLPVEEKPIQVGNEIIIRGAQAHQQIKD